MQGASAKRVPSVQERTDKEKGDRPIFRGVPGRRTVENQKIGLSPFSFLNGSGQQETVRVGAWRRCVWQQGIPARVRSDEREARTA